MREYYLTACVFVISGLTTHANVDSAGLIGHRTLDGGNANNVTGLVAYYPFNGNANDESGNRYDGVVSGTTTLAADRFGNTGRAYYFDGNTNGGIEAPNTSNLNFTSSGFSLFAWVCITNYNDDSIIAGKHNYGYYNGYLINVTHGCFAFYLNENPRLVAEESCVDGQWHHVAGIWDGTTAYLYVDGVLKRSGPGNYANFNNANFTIGRATGIHPPGWLNGKIDEVRLYNCALSSNEVRRLYEQGSTLGGDSALYFSKRDTSNEDYDLHTIRPDPINPNLQAVPMNDPSGDQKHPVVSPDGRFVLYAIGSAAYQSFQVWALDRLTGQRQYLFEGLALDWHPSGQRFAFIPNAFCSTTIHEAFVNVTPTGLVISSTRLVFDCAPDYPAGALGMQYSPDGRSIAYNYNPNAGCYAGQGYVNSEIYTASLEEELPIPLNRCARLTTNSVCDYEPHWTPDGRQILWGRGRSGGPDLELWRKNADGSGAEQLVGIWSNASDAYLAFCTPPAGYTGPYQAAFYHQTMKNIVLLRNDGGQQTLGIGTNDFVDGLDWVSVPSSVPLISRPLTPTSVAPGGETFTLIVNGTGFVPTSLVKWNGNARATTYIDHSQLTVAIPASDIAATGTARITVSNPAPGGGVSDLAFFPIASPATSVLLHRTDYNSPRDNIQVVTADFNGDGRLDLASADWDGSQVAVFLGNGDGTFQPYRAYSACGAHALAIGDFNGDGQIDLAIANRGCRRVYLLVGNGDGTFRAGESFAAPGGPYSLAAGDFNSDGKLDVASANEWAGSVSVFLGYGDGTFQSPNNYPIGSDSRGIVTADFNGDGRLDLAVSTMDRFVSIVLGNGDGTFQPPFPVPTDHDGNHYLIASDLNRDSRPDLAVASISGWVSVLLSNGDGTFRTGANYATGGHSMSVAAEDFNADGILDLMTANYDSVNLSLLLGKIDGTFQTHVDYPATPGSYPRGLAVGDFNEDGKLDLAIGNQGNYSLSVFLQTSAPVIDSIMPSPGYTATNESVELMIQVHSPAGVAQVTVNGNAAQLRNVNPLLSYAEPIRVRFVNPSSPPLPAVTDFVSIRGDRWSDGLGLVTLEAYDLEGRLLGSAMDTDDHPVTLSVNYAGIHSVLLREANPSVAWDDLSFNRPTNGELVTVDFESLTGMTYMPGNAVPAFARLSNQLASAQGVIFSSKSGAPYVAVVELGYGHATSGRNGIGGVTNDNTWLYTAPLSVGTNTLIVCATDYLGLTATSTVRYVRLPTTTRNDSALYFSKRAASSGDYDLHTIRPDPLNPNLQSVPMNDSSGDQCYPMVSPDGRFVLFTGRITPSPAYQIWVLDRTTGEKRFLLDGHPEGWHPSGQRFVYTSNEFCNEAIREAFVNVTPTGLVIASTRLLFDSDRPAGAVGVQYSPDGAHIAFDYGIDGCWYDYHEICVGSITGSLPIPESALTRLTTDSWSDSQPHWTPDGRKIMWGRGRSDQNYMNLELWRKNADGSGSEELAGIWTNSGNGYLSFCAPPAGYTGPYHGAFYHQTLKKIVLLRNDGGQDTLDIGTNDSVDGLHWVNTIGPSSSGLIGHWTFDGGNAHDVSGNGNDGVIIGSAPTNGIFSGAYHFDGNDRIEVGNLSFTDQQYTVNGWIRTTEPGVRDCFRMWIGKMNVLSGNATFDIVLGDGVVNRTSGLKGPIYDVWLGGTTPVNLWDADLNLRDGRWHMVTATYRNGSQRLYVDSVLVSESQYNGPLPLVSNVVAIGGIDGFGPYHHPWIGDIDEVAIYNRALEPSEVAALWSSTDSDTNDNDLPDAWEFRCFGNLNQTRDGDPDGDGLSNIREFIAGTSPTDARSVFAILNTGVTSSSQYVIRWYSVFGELYNLYKSTNLMSGFNILKSGIPAVPPINSYTDTVGNAEATYYKVGVR